MRLSALALMAKMNTGDINDPNNIAVGKTWSGVDIDPSLALKVFWCSCDIQRHNVKTLISVGGWAETGGHFDKDGDRVADGGFYTMTTNVMVR